MKQTAIAVEALRIGYGQSRVLKGLSLDVKPGELLAVLGPSGCGKTTLLKAVAGLAAPEAGDIRFDGASQLGLPAEKRDVAMVFQRPLLFPHLTVMENVAFGLKMRGVVEAQRRARVYEALRMVRLEEFAQRRPDQLSGGQEQRVALARALVTEPRVLLLDEPFSALDAILREEMWRLFGDLQRRLRTTTLFVTHDQQEALTLAGRIALMLEGVIEQVGAGSEFFEAPRTAAAARFFGWQVFPGGLLGRDGVVGFRPEAVELVDPDSTIVAGTVETVVRLGARIRLRVRLLNDAVMDVDRPWNDPRASGASAGAGVGLLIPEALVRVFPA